MSEDQTLADLLSIQPTQGESQIVEQVPEERRTSIEAAVTSALTNTGRLYTENGHSDEATKLSAPDLVLKHEIVDFLATVRPDQLKAAFIVALNNEGSENPNTNGFRGFFAGSPEIGAKFAGSLAETLLNNPVGLQLLAELCVEGSINSLDSESLAVVFSDPTRFAQAVKEALSRGLVLTEDQVQSGYNDTTHAPKVAEELLKTYSAKQNRGVGLALCANVIRAATATSGSRIGSDTFYGAEEPHGAFTTQLAKHLQLSDEQLATTLDLKPNWGK